MLTLVVAIFGSVEPAKAQRRVALVIGNSAYTHTPALANPRNDAADVAAALAGFGYEVVKGYDLDKPGFDRTVKTFAETLRGADTGVFFYAGHALQVHGQNYLIPIDAELSAAAALDFETVRLDLIQRTMESQARTNILFLDACRDNPLMRNLARSLGTRSSAMGKGLASVEAGVGTLISFSTQPGNVALDGGGRNSPFAGALVRNMRQSTDDLSTLLISVRNDVIKATDNRQVPWEHSSLTRRFYFNPTALSAPSTGPPAGRTAPRDEAADAWAAAKESTSPAVLEAFVTRYAGSFYAELARDRIQALKSQQAAATPTATSAPSDAATSTPSPSEPWTLTGNNSLDLLGGRVLFSMIGTPYGWRKDQVGVRVNGETASLAVGQFINLGRDGEVCGIFLRELRAKERQADFQVLCGAAYGNPSQDRARLSVNLPAVAPKAEVVTMEQGTSHEFKAGSETVLIAFLGTPYRGRRDLAGVRVNGEEKSLAIGLKADVSAGDLACAFVLRQIHTGNKSAEFQWQC
ncbi:MAG: caspase domain-containing protein [Hyphomicrobiaceae bacterium]